MATNLSHEPLPYVVYLTIQTSLGATLVRSEKVVAYSIVEAMIQASRSVEAQNIDATVTVTGAEPDVPAYLATLELNDALSRESFDGQYDA